MPSKFSSNSTYLSIYTQRKGDMLPTEFLPDALIISPAKDGRAQDSNPTKADLNLANKLDELSSQGVKIITLDTKIDKPKENKSIIPWVHISSDFVKGGRMAANALLNAIGRRGGIVIFAGPKYHPSAIERRLGFLDVIEEYAPNVKLLNIVYCRFTSDDVSTIGEVVQELVQDGEGMRPKLRGIFCEADVLARDVLQAYESLFEQPPIIVGFDGIKEEVAREIAHRKIYVSIDVKVEEQVDMAWKIATTGKNWSLDAVQPLIDPEILGFHQAKDYLRDHTQRL